MDTLMQATPLTAPVGKPQLRGIHHLALVTDDMRKTLDFYVRILGMPLVHGLITPGKKGDLTRVSGDSSHGRGVPPFAAITHFFLDMGGDSLLAFFEYPKGKVGPCDRDTIGAMQHVSFVCGPKRYREILDRLKANRVEITAGPLISIPPAIHSFYFFDPNGTRLEVVSDLDGAEDDLQVVRSTLMDEPTMRRELKLVSDDAKWIDEMVQLMPR